MALRLRKGAPAAGVDPSVRIVEVATRLFIQHGYNGVSYLDIARELGTTHSKIHYYFRTKDVLAEAVLRRVAESTLAAMKALWTDPGTSLQEKFVGTRDWIHGQYLQFNPGGRGGRPWGLLSRFSLEADALSSTMRRVIRTCLDRLAEHIGTGVRLAVENRELVPAAPQQGIALQIESLMMVTGQLTRHASGFERLHDLMRWTYLGIERAYGSAGRRARGWPELGPVRPDPDLASPIRPPPAHDR